jgi:acyl CoA:acetate/3-ketoacid CoA transferase alpha subunit
MAEIVSLAEAVALAVRDGDIVAMEGFTHLIPFAAGHEVIRQRRRLRVPEDAAARLRRRPRDRRILP